MESCFRYSIAVGYITSLEGDENNLVVPDVRHWRGFARGRVLSFCFEIVRRRKDMSLSFRQPRRKRPGFICPGSSYLAVALLFTSAPPATHGQSLDQLYHRSWTVRDGAPASVPTIAQAADGFLWLGTDNGLARFDGESFEPYHPLSGGDLLSGYI